MLGPGDQVGRVGLERVFRAGETVLGAQNAATGGVDDAGLYMAGLDGGQKRVAEDQGLGVLHIQPGGCSVDIPQPVDPIRMHKAVKAPLAAQDVRQELAVLSAIDAIPLVVGAHHAGAAGVDRALEVGKVDLAHGAAVAADVDREADVFDGVHREVLHRGDDVMGLQPDGEGGAHFSEMVRILAIGLLSPSPPRVAQEVHADRAGEGAPLGARLNAHDLADAALQVDIEGRPPGHGAGKAGGVAPGDAARPVREEEGRNAEALAPSAGGVGFASPAPAALGVLDEEAAPRHHGDLFRHRRFRQDGVDPRLLL